MSTIIRDFYSSNSFDTAGAAGVCCGLKVKTSSFV